MESGTPALLGDVEQLEAVAQAGATGRAFVIVGWTPRERVPELRLELERAAGGELALDEVSTPPEVEPPVLMRNRGSLGRLSSSCAFSIYRAPELSTRPS